MTECERLIAIGTFSPDFFKPEVRCDFLVDEKRKKLWAIQIDLFLQLEKVCKRHGLTYFAAGGTILGAYRHRGFIPWDDDIDINMPRKDYLRLQECADEFEYPYYLQIPGKDHEYCYSYTKLRNSQTTQVSKPFSHRSFNQGVQIDIFPVDKWDTKKGEASFHRINELNIDNSNYLRQGMIDPSEKDIERIQSWSVVSPIENMREIDRLATQFNRRSNATVMTIPVSTIYPYHKIQFPSCAFDSTLRLPFEHIEMTVPIGAISIMEMQFGDWRKFPPVEKRGAWHDSEMFDPDVPYLNFLADYRSSWKGVVS